MSLIRLTSLNKLINNVGLRLLNHPNCLKLSRNDFLFTNCRTMTQNGSSLVGQARFLSAKSLLNNQNNMSIKIRQNRQMHTSSTIYNSPNNNNNDDNINNDSDFPPNESTKMNALTTAHVPEDFPKIPMVAVSRNPLFPRFIKMIEV